MTVRLSKTKEGISENLRFFVGVKEVCGLIPDLFGIFTHELGEVLKDLEGSAAPVLPVRMPHKKILLGRRVPLLLYADDALAGLMSTTLQVLQNQLSAFCTARSLPVNVAKSKVMVFEKHPTESPSFSYDGQTVEQVAQFKHPELTFDASQGALYAPEDLTVAGTKACHALHHRCAKMHLQDLPAPV